MGVIYFCFRTRFPYHKLEADPVRNTIVFKNGEDSFTVEELVAQLIQKARDFAEESTSRNQYFSPPFYLLHPLINNSIQF